MNETSISDSVTIECVTTLQSWPPLDAMLRAYLPWVMREVETLFGFRFENFAQEAEVHHAAFAEEALKMMEGEGFLLLARLKHVPAGVVALKHVDAATAEVKRLYVRPDARGHGIGRALMEHLLRKARQSGYRTLRLETMSFMKAAVAMYRSLGFEEVDAFGGSQSAVSGLAHMTCFMRLDL
jgi:GNAT superfamily N-acetyltransferase